MTKKTEVLCLLVFTGIFLALSIRRGVKNKINILIPAEHFNYLESPMQYESNAASPYIYIEPGTGRGWKNEAGGLARYTLKIDQSGAYHFWSKVHWEDGCGNAYYLTVGNYKKITFGNDADFNAWHWVKGPFYRLEKGEYIVEIANHSDGIGMEKLLFSNDPDFKPWLNEPQLTRFYDGFGGCDGNNTGSWDTIKGEWQVMENLENDSAGISESIFCGTGEGLITTGRDWKNYKLKCIMLPVSDAQAGLVFNYFDIKNYFCIFISAGETNNCILKKIINGREQIIKKAGWSIQTDKWYALCLQNTNGTISFKLNDNSLFSNITDHSIEQGKIGLITQNNSGVYFDNVDVVFY